MKSLTLLIFSVFGSLAYVAISGIIKAMQYFDAITGYGVMP
jgi:hypothetical protein